MARIESILVVCLALSACGPVGADSRGGEDEATNGSGDPCGDTADCKWDEVCIAPPTASPGEELEGACRAHSDEPCFLFVEGGRAHNSYTCY